jgi:hypothetical protein
MFQFCEKPAQIANFTEVSAGVSRPASVPNCMDTIITSRELQVERKHFFVEFCENPRGRFLRITEDSHGRRNTVIVPSTGLEEFTEVINEVASVQDKLGTGT